MYSNHSKTCKNEHLHGDFFLLHYSCMIQAFCIKAAQIEFSLILILTRKGEFKVDITMLKMHLKVALN